MNLSQKIDWLSDYFNENIEHYTVPCLKRLKEEIVPDEHGQRGCAVSLASTSFAILDLFGYLLRPDRNAKPEETGKNLRFMFEGGDGLFAPAFNNRQSELLVKLFRHGVAHQYFPKNAGIAKAGNLPLLIRTDNAEGSRHVPVLNVDALATSTLESVHKTKERLLSATTPLIVDRFFDRLCSMLKDDREAMLSACEGSLEGILHVETFSFTGAPGMGMDVSPPLP